MVSIGFVGIYLYHSTNLPKKKTENLKGCQPFVPDSPNLSFNACIRFD